MKKRILLLVGILLITITVVIVFIISQNKGKNEDLPVIENIEIICDDITMYLDDKPTKLNYEIVNKDNLMFTKNLSTTNDCVILDDDNIIPNKVGTSQIIIKLITKNNTFTKTVSVTVLATECNIDLKIQDINKNFVDKLFVGNSYYLIATISKTLNYDYQIDTSENISDFKFVENKNNNIMFSFKIQSYKQTKFIFKYKGVEKSLQLPIYEYISNINVNFNNEIKDELNLTLFNNDYKDMVNQDEIYDSCIFKIEENANCINEYEVQVSNSNIATIQNNKIIAVAEGECDFIVKALDGSLFQKVIKINVNKAKINNLNFAENEITVFVNEIVNFETTYTPKYSICNIQYYLNNEILQDTKISFYNAGEYYITAKDEISGITDVFKIIVKDIKLGKITVSFNSSFLTKYEGTFENDILTLNLIPDEIYFSYQIENCDNISINISFSNQTIIGSYEQISNAVIIDIISFGETTVTLISTENENIKYSFKIVIHN